MANDGQQPGRDGVRGGALLARWPAWLLAPFVAGMALRLAGLGRQILGGDELHAVRAALAKPLLELLTTYQRNDNCLPLSGLYRLLVSAGAPLTEWVLRLPMLLAGALLLIAGPLWARRVGGRTTAVAFAWLLALAPFLVAYSRIARSYLPMVLLSAAAAAAFWEWLATERRRFGAAYAVLGALAIYFHPVAAPLVCMPVAFAALEILTRRGGAPGWRRLLGVGLGLVAAMATYLVPGFASLRDLAAVKHRPSELPDLAGVGETVRLLAGTASWPLAALFWGAALAGLAVLARRLPRLAIYTGALVVAQVIGVWLMAPSGAAHPLVVNRYLLPALPIVLLWIAILLGAAAGRATARAGGGSRWPIADLVAIGLPVGFALGGPLAGSWAVASSFAHSNDRLRFTCELPAATEQDVPAWYRELAGVGASAGPVVESPWPTAWNLARSWPAYEAMHGQEVLVSPSDPSLRDPRLRLRNAPPPDPERLLAGRGRFLVLHLDLAAEEGRVPAAVCSSIGGSAKIRPERAEQLRADARNSLVRLRRTFDRPDWRDETMAVWDLERVRRDRLERRGSNARKPEPGRPPGR